MTDLLLVPDPATADFDAVLADLRRLTRDHLLYFRLETGRLLLDRFFAGQSADYQDRANNKEASFIQFARTRATDLADIGLREQTLRQCIIVHIVWRTLPNEVREQLGFSRIVELSRVSDPTLRARLAVAAHGEQWSVDRLKDTIGAAKAGLWYDQEADEPGTQPPPLPTPDAKRPQPGRLVSRAERFRTEVEALSKQWQGVGAVKPKQRLRLAHAIDGIRAELASLERHVRPE